MTKNESNEILKLNNIESIAYDDRELILTRLNEVIKMLHEKVVKGRITKPENDKIRIQWIKAFVYTCNVYNQVKRDVEVDELKQELKTIKEQLKNEIR